MGAKPPAVIVDVDGTLVDVRSIRHHVTGPRRDFHAFHTAAIDCPPHPRVLNQVHRLAHDGNAIVVVTARSRIYERHTAMWLALHRVPSIEMHMRRRGDTRPDTDVKREILAALRHRWEITHAIDDNPHVIALWKQHNIPVTVVPGWEEQDTPG